MPLWDFHIVEQFFTEEEMAKIAETITKIYTQVGMPAFYVQVRFNESPKRRNFVGGTAQDNMIYVQIYHIARSFESEKQKQSFLAAIEHVLQPFREKKGADSEYFVLEGSRDLWRINGIIPPPTRSDEEKAWAESNRPRMWQGG